MPAREATIFDAIFDNSSATASLASNFTPTQADIGVNYGLTKDAAGAFWYIDKNKTGAAAILQIVGLGALGSVVNGLVKFVFLPASIQKY